jgi:antitoxin component of MazEF toxin-antitoxin module
MNKINNRQIRKTIRFGNSLGITLPKKTLKELNINLGDYIKINIEKINQDEEDE